MTALSTILPDSVANIRLPSSSSNPKVSRGMKVSVSMPTVAKNTPKAAAIMAATSAFRSSTTREATRTYDDSCSLSKRHDVPIEQSVYKHSKAIGCDRTSLARHRLAQTLALK